MPKRRLLTPGPVEVPEAALLAMGKQVWNHRTPEFRRTIAEVTDGLKYVFQTANDVLILSSSGTGAMEAAVVNLVPRGGKCIVLESGKFAERWREIAERFGINVVSYKLPWGEAFEAAEVGKLLQQHPDAVAVFSTLQETSTGVAHHIEAIGRVVKSGKALFVVDGISGVGAVECRSDAWGIDVLVVGSQKALMTPPGLAFLAVSPAAWKQIESIDRPAFYFDLLAYRKSARESETPFTPSIPLVEALAESLKIIRRSGIENFWLQAAHLSQITQTGIAAMNLRLVAKRPAPGLTAVYLPEAIDGKAFLQRIYERFGVKLAGGQGHLKGRIFRLSHMGLVDELDIVAALTAIELTLIEIGQPLETGAAATAAARVISQAKNR